MFIQLMPIVVLILVSLLSQMMVSPPPYSLYSRPYVNDFSCCSLLSVISVSHTEITAAVNTLSSSRSTGQTVKRQTENLHVDYYVTRDFKSEYKASALQQIEKNVEEDYVSNVRNNCWKERQMSESPQQRHYCPRSFFLNTFQLLIMLFFSFQKRTCCTPQRSTGTTACGRRQS